MARLSREARFEKRIQDRRDAVKHMRARVTQLKRSYREVNSLKEQDAISDKIEFLEGVINTTVTNLNPKRRAPVKSMADMAAEQSDEQAHLYDGDRSSLAGLGDLVSIAA